MRKKEKLKQLLLRLPNQRKKKHQRRRKLRMILIKKLKLLPPNPLMIKIKQLKPPSNKKKPTKPKKTMQLPVLEPQVKVSFHQNLWDQEVVFSNSQHNIYHKNK